MSQIINQMYLNHLINLGLIPNATTPIDVSTKYLVSYVLITVLLLKLGFHAGDSSITKIFFNAFAYKKTCLHLKNYYHL